MGRKLIYLDAAIAVADYTDYPGLAIEDVKKVTDEVVKGLKQLPSAQSEIVRCKDCRWHETDINQCGPAGMRCHV